MFFLQKTLRHARLGLLLLVLIGSSFGFTVQAQAGDPGDCTSRDLRTVNALLADAQDAIDDDDVTTALENINEAQSILDACGPGGRAGTEPDTVDAPFEIAAGGTKVFTADDETYSFEYPEDWFFVTDLGERAVATNTVDASVQVLQENPVPARGDLWVFISAFDFGRVRNLTTYIEDVVAEVRPEADLGETVEFEISGPSRGEVRRVAFIDLLDLDQRVLMVEINDGWWGVMFINARERDLDSFMPEILVVASTLVHED